MQKARCLECGEALVGRSDKKFCHELCRSSYHNRQNALHSKKINRINAGLRHNRKILMQLIQNHKKKVSRSLLSSLGFNFHLITSVMNQNGHPCYCCYEYAYLQIDDQLLELKQLTEKDYF
ncbi:MAG: hypothetical protein GC180_06015 [Bacteroidetes bacterium]|nr:hypothetical protein [Bacteroidota bacterium]